MNPIALVLIALGALAILFGLLFAQQRNRGVGRAVVLLGLILIATPVIISSYLALFPP